MIYFTCDGSYPSKLKIFERGFAVRFFYKIPASLLLLTLLCFSSPGKTGPNQTLSSSSVTDLITVSENGETYVFLIDIKTQSLFQARVVREVSESSKTTQEEKGLKLEPVPLTEKIDEPWALAYFQRKLYICEKDESSAAVYEVDIFSNEQVKYSVF